MSQRTKQRNSRRKSSGGENADTVAAPQAEASERDAAEATASAAISHATEGDEARAAETDLGSEESAGDADAAQAASSEPDSQLDAGLADADDPRSREDLKRALEALIFVADRIVTAVQLGRIVKLRGAEVKPILAELMEDYRDRGIELCEVGGGYRFRSSPASARYVRSLVAQRPVRLTRAQLETLALVAYRQPITRPEIDDVRGVDTGSAVRVLLERGLIKMLGRKDEPGRPLLYGTTPYFLEFFGLASLQDLPTLREFTELTDEHRELFRRKTGDDVEDVEAELAAERDHQMEASEADDADTEIDAAEADRASASDDSDGELGDGGPGDDAEGEAEARSESADPELQAGAERALAEGEEVHEHVGARDADA